MAKSAKGGLGRGLDSLLGSSTGAPAHKQKKEAQPQVPEREHIVLEPGEIPEYDPILEPREPVSVETIVKDSNEYETLGQDESITIHGIVTRETVRKVEIPTEVNIEDVIPNPDQPRTLFDEEEMRELAASIEKEGLLQPLLVRRVEDNKYQIIAGERRWQAARMAGLEMVPIVLRDADDNKALELALIENVQRTDLNPIEEAYGYRRLMERNGLTQSEVAQMVSKGRSTIAKSLRLLELPELAQQLLFEDKITAAHARAILSVPTKEGRQILTEKLIEKKMSVRDTEALARLLSGKSTDEEKAKRQPMPDSYKRVAKALRDAFHTNVRIRSSKGKNKIEIEFKDEEELSRLFESLVHQESGQTE